MWHICCPYYKKSVCVMNEMTTDAPVWYSFAWCVWVSLPKACGWKSFSFGNILWSCELKVCVLVYVWGEVDGSSLLFPQLLVNGKHKGSVSIKPPNTLNAMEAGGLFTVKITFQMILKCSHFFNVPCIYYIGPGIWLNWKCWFSDQNGLSSADSNSNTSLIFEINLRN